MLWETPGLTSEPPARMIPQAAEIETHSHGCVMMTANLYPAPGAAPVQELLAAEGREQAPSRWATAGRDALSTLLR